MIIIIYAVNLTGILIKDKGVFIFEIMEGLKELEPSLSMDLLKRSIPATLSMAATSENAELKRYKNEKNEWVYDLKK